MFTPLFCFLFQDENGEVLSPFAAVGASSVSATAQSVRERFGELSSVSSTSSSMSPLPQSPAQAMAYRGREGSFESRYQSPIDDFRVSQETLLDMDAQNRRCVCVCGVSLFVVLDACPECFGRVEDYRHYPVFVFTSGSRGGPEWRTVSKSKPIRTHFCCNPPFLLPIPTTQSPLPRTDDVTDCCEQFPWKRPPPLWPTFQAALSPSIRPTPPPLSLSPTLSFCLCPSLPAAQPLFTTCQTRR